MMDDFDTIQYGQLEALDKGFRSFEHVDFKSFLRSVRVHEPRARDRFGDVCGTSAYRTIRVVMSLCAPRGWKRLISIRMDPHNSQYALYLMSLCNERQRQKEVTWVWSRWSVQSATFQETYGSSVTNFLEDPEAHFRWITNRN